MQHARTHKHKNTHTHTRTSTRTCTTQHSTTQHTHTQACAQATVQVNTAEGSVHVIRYMASPLPLHFPREWSPINHVKWHFIRTIGKFLCRIHHACDCTQSTRRIWECPQLDRLQELASAQGVEESFARQEEYTCLPVQ